MTTLDNTLDNIKELLDKIKNYNNSVIELNSILMYQQTYGDMQSSEFVKKSIDSLIWTKYYGWYESETSPIEEYLSVLEDKHNIDDESIMKCFNYNSINEYFNSEFKDEYNKCVNKHRINSIDYIELLIKILLINIDKILDYIVSLELEDNYLKNEKVRLYDELRNVVSNKHKGLRKTAVSDRTKKRNNLIDEITMCLNSLELKKEALELLRKDTNHDLEMFYGIYKKLCLFENELMSTKEDKTDKSVSNQNKINKLISSVEEYKLTENELEIAEMYLDSSIVEQLKTNIVAYRPIVFDMKKRQKKKTL